MCETHTVTEPDYRIVLTGNACTISSRENEIGRKIAKQIKLVDDRVIHGHIPRPNGNGDTDQTNLWEESVTMMYFLFWTSEKKEMLLTSLRGAKFLTSRREPKSSVGVKLRGISACSIWNCAMISCVWWVKRLRRGLKKRENTLRENRLRRSQRLECYHGTAGYQQCVHHW
jgi:hypothetical protein